VQTLARDPYAAPAVRQRHHDEQARGHLRRLARRRVLRAPVAEHVDLTARDAAPDENGSKFACRQGKGPVRRIHCEMARDCRLFRCVAPFARIGDATLSAFALPRSTNQSGKADPDLEG
jgi:hypothetical protein